MRQSWADYRLFFQEFRRTFESTGALMPSGKQLAKALSRQVRESSGAKLRPRRILEVGPGTGSVTAQILCDMRQDDRLDMVERNALFARRLSERFSLNSGGQIENGSAIRIRLIESSLEDLPEGSENRYDVIVSGLPLNNFPAELVESLLAKLERLLLPGGTLSFFEYIAIRRAKSVLSRGGERQRLSEIGKSLHRMFARGEVRHDWVLRNVPPAWVHHVRFSQPDEREHQPLRPL